MITKSIDIIDSAYTRFYMSLYKRNKANYLSYLSSIISNGLKIKNHVENRFSTLHCFFWLVVLVRW